MGTYAVIDIGTNSLKMHVARVNDDKVDLFDAPCDTPFWTVR